MADMYIKKLVDLILLSISMYIYSDSDESDNVNESSESTSNINFLIYMSAILDSPVCLKNLKFRFKHLLLIIVYEKNSHKPKSADLKEFVHGERR